MAVEINSVFKEALELDEQRVELVKNIRSRVMQGLAIGESEKEFIEVLESKIEEEEKLLGSVKEMVRSEDVILSEEDEEMVRKLCIKKKALKLSIHRINRELAEE